MSEEVHEDVTSYNGRPSRKKGCVVYRLSFFFFFESSQVFIRAVMQWEQCAWDYHR